MKRAKTLATAIMIGSMAITPVMTVALPITTYAAAKTALGSVENAHWGDKKDEEEGYYAHWDAVENAKKYEIALYYLNDNDGYTKVTSITTTGTSVNLKNKMTKTADYVFKIRAVGTGKYSNGSWSDYTDETYYEKISSSSAASSSTSSSNSSSANTSSGGPAASSDKVTGRETSVSQSMQNQNTQTNVDAHWIQNEKGWWCSTNTDNTAWYANCWQWVDGNKDGIAECYYFNGDGYTLLNTVTPDGYSVDGNGAWIVNGVVQVKHQ